MGRNCTIAEFIEQKKLTFQRGCVFYEFTRNEEDINAEKEVILMDKVAIFLKLSMHTCIKTISFQSKNLYTGIKACKIIGAPGLRIPNPKLESYSVFVQSMGIGHRPLKAGSHILYDQEVHKN